MNGAKNEMIKTLIALLLLFVSNNSAVAETMSCNKHQSTYQCLVCNCYHESRGEPREGKIAVAKTVLSRAESRSYPDTACEVVYQPWQFSWTNDRISNNISTRNSTDRKSLQDCREAADTAIDQGPNGLTFFYNPRVVTPAWARRVRACGKVGHHLFLVPRGAKCPKHLGDDGSESNNSRSNKKQESSSTEGSR